MDAELGTIFRECKLKVITREGTRKASTASAPLDGALAAILHAGSLVQQVHMQLVMKVYRHGLLVHQGHVVVGSR